MNYLKEKLQMADGILATHPAPVNGRIYTAWEDGGLPIAMTEDRLAGLHPEWQELARIILKAFRICAAQGLPDVDQATAAALAIHDLRLGAESAY